MTLMTVKDKLKAYYDNSSVTVCPCQTKIPKTRSFAHSKVSWNRCCGSRPAPRSSRKIFVIRGTNWTSILTSLPGSTSTPSVLSRPRTRLLFERQPPTHNTLWTFRNVFSFVLVSTANTWPLFEARSCGRFWTNRIVCLPLRNSKEGRTRLGRRSIFESGGTKRIFTFLRP